MPRSAHPFTDQVRILIAERQMSLRRLARGIGVNESTLSRVLNPAEPKRASVELMQRVAEALDVPEEQFPELREARVIERIRRDPRLRDRLFDELAKDRRRQPRN